MSASQAARGEVWTVSLDPVRGHEQAGTRPALIVSVGSFNQGPAGLAARFAGNSFPNRGFDEQNR